MHNKYRRIQKMWLWRNPGISSWIRTIFTIVKMMDVKIVCLPFVIGYNVRKMDKFLSERQGNERRIFHNDLKIYWKSRASDIWRIGIRGFHNKAVFARTKLRQILCNTLLRLRTEFPVEKWFYTYNSTAWNSNVDIFTTVMEGNLC